MADAPLILGVSGLRGIVGESLTPEVAVRYAGAFGEWLRDRIGGARRPQVVIGRDGRVGGEAVQLAVESALLGTGCSVWSTGVAMTPSVGVAVDTMGFDAGMVITASHNPQQWNGIKLLVRERSWDRESMQDGRGEVSSSHANVCAPNARQANQIINGFQGERFVWRAWDALGKSDWTCDSNAQHCLLVKRAIESTIGRSWHAMMADGAVRRCVSDSVNSSGGSVSRDFFARGVVELVQLHASDSGIFPHTPEPTAENLSGEGGLCDAVPGLKADVGFAQDPDADRLAIVDEHGRYIGEEYTLVLCAQALLRDRGADEPTAHLVANLSTSRMIDDVAAKHGAVVHRTAVGEANVVERMKALKAEGHEVVLGGEGNGGVIWPEVVYVRDSLGSMALVLSLMARTGKTVSELVAEIDALAAGGAGYAIVKRKVEIASKADAKPAVQAVARAYASERVDRQDGVRVDFEGGEKAGKWAGSWVHVRASNTEPIMRVIVEAPTAEAAGALADEVGRVIAAG
ncbi:MAG: hypothetical protein AAF356_11360 [Planctomycetota bacterium]